MQPQLLVLGILLLLVGVAPVGGKKRARVRVFGATVGSNFVRKEGQSERTTYTSILLYKAQGPTFHLQPAASIPSAI